MYVDRTAHFQAKNRHSAMGIWKENVIKLIFTIPPKIPIL